MENLVFLYNIVCYSIGFAVLLFAILTAFLKKKPEEWAYVLVTVSFFLILLPVTILSYISAVTGQPSPYARNILGVFIMCGIALMVYAGPRFIHAVTRYGNARLVDSFFLLLSLIVFITAMVFCSVGSDVLALRILMATLVVANVYSVVAGVIYRRKKDAQGERIVLERRWAGIIKSFVIITACLLPFSILIDVFRDWLPALSSLFPERWKVVSLAFLLWNLTYVYFTLPLYLKGAPTAETGKEWDFDKFSLSRRERQIALLVIEGLSYKKIAEKLFISLATVKTHIIHIYSKTGASNKMVLAQKCRRTSPASLKINHSID
jgi:DNA-binding CsgD family transcriptional regulator